MKKVTLLTTFLLLATYSIFSQKTLTVQKIAGQPVVDGDITDSIWNQVTAFDGFTMAYPQFGGAAQSATAIKIGYTDKGIYIAAQCTSAKVRRDGSIRDEKGTGDFLSVGLDTWNDDQYAFAFTVSASGQRTEERISSKQSEPDFDTPWLAHTKIQANGWTAEMFIPFRSVRYPRDGMQDWGIQFTRFDRNTGETSTWSPQNPLIEDHVLQYGNLEGLDIPKQCERLGVTNQSGTETVWSRQYLALADTIYYDFKTPAAHTIQSRLDGRWGPSPNTTIDFTMIPTLERSKYQSFYDQRDLTIVSRTTNPKLNTPRPLEAEENSLFNKTLGLRYVNGFPFEDMSNFSTLAPPVRLTYTDGGTLINQVKLTARPTQSLSIGVSNAVYSKAYSYFSNFSGGQVEPLSTRKYPVLNQVSIEKVFRNNSWVQVSNMHEFIDSPNGINIATAAGQWRDKSNQYELSGRVGVTSIQSNDNFTRLNGEAAIRKINGIWVWNAGYTSHGQYSNPNFTVRIPLEDQTHIARAGIEKRNFSPSGTYWLNTQKGAYALLYVDNVTKKTENLSIGTSWSGLNKSYNRIGASVGLVTLKQSEFLFLPTTLARKIPPSILLNGSWASDERKRLILSTNVNADKNLVQKEDRWTGLGRIQYVPHAKLRLTASCMYSLSTNFRSQIIDISPEFGVEKSNLQNIVIDADIQFTPIPKLVFGAGFSRMAFRQLNRRAFRLQPDGTLQPADYTFNNNPNSLSVRPNLFMAWYISPLRQINISWKSSREVYQYLIPVPVPDLNYHNRFNTLNISAIFSLYN